MSKKSTNLCSGFLISYDWLPALESLSADDFHSLLFALIRRQKDREPFPDFANPTVGIFAKMIEPTIKRRLDGQSGGNKANEGTTAGTMVGTTVDTATVTTADTTEGSKVKKSKEEDILVISNDITNSAKTRKRFIKPTVDEVREYCRERGNTVDAETFVNFYDSKDWMVDKNKMKDWKASVRTWERERQAKQITKPQSEPVGSFGNSFDEDEFFQAALESSQRRMQNALQGK